MIMDESIIRPTVSRAVPSFSEKTKNENRVIKEKDRTIFDALDNGVTCSARVGNYEVEELKLIV